MERWDAEFTGTVISLFGMAVIFLAALTETVLRVDVGRYGSPAAALVFASVGIVGGAFRLRACDNGENAALARSGSLGCVAATIVLLNPMPSIFGQVALVGAVLGGFGGAVAVGTVVYRHHADPS